MMPNGMVGSRIFLCYPDTSNPTIEHIFSHNLELHLQQLNGTIDSGIVPASVDVTVQWLHAGSLAKFLTISTVSSVVPSPLLNL